MAGERKWSDILKDLGESSSLHGIPKIVSSRQIAVKVLWTILLIGMTGFLTYQLTELFAEYSSYPVKTTITLKYSPLRFPAVTVCNMNPIRQSMLPFDGEFSTLLTKGSLDNGNESIWETIQYIYYDEEGDVAYITEYDNYNDTVDVSPEFDLKKDDYELWRERVFLALRKIPRKERFSMGAQAKTFVHKATFAGYRLADEIFDLELTTEFGNCYTIDNDYFESKRSGPASGLHLILNTELTEYIPQFATGYGARIVIHEPGTFPHPDRDGITVNNAYETNIAVKMIDIRRLGGVYGECTDGKEFEKNYEVKYTIHTCFARCEIENMLANCGCIPAKTPDIWDMDVPFCDIGNETIVECSESILDKIDYGEIECNCHSRCNEKAFKTVLASGRKWPNPTYLENVLMKESCSKNLSSMRDICAEIKAKNYLNLETYEGNFLSVNVYFEDLNYESIVEEPLYNTVRFMSDIGGTLGLYVGASVLTYVELLQFILEAVLYLKQKMTSRATSSKISQIKQNYMNETIVSEKTKNRKIFCS